MALHNLVSFGAEMVPASVSYTIIRKHADQGLFMGAADDDVQWRILSGKSRYAEHLPFLSRSAAIFRVSLNYTSLFLHLPTNPKANIIFAGSNVF